MGKKSFEENLVALAEKQEFEKQLLNEAAQKIKENETSELDEPGTVKQDQQTERDKELTRLYERIVELGGPSKAEVDEAKGEFNNKVYVTAFDENEIYIYRYITRVEYKEIMRQVASMSKLESYELSDLMDTLIVTRCLLWPTMSESLKIKMPGGTIETLANQIRFSSNFMSDELAVRNIIKL